MENDNYDEEDRDNYYDWLDKLNERSFCTAVVRKTDNCFLGYVAIKDISHELWEISIEFLNKFCRCGYGTQSLKMFIDKVSEITGRIEYKALVEVDNSASQALMTKLGGVLIGIENISFLSDKAAEAFESEHLADITEHMTELAEELEIESRKLLSNVMEYRLNLKYM